MLNSFREMLFSNFMPHGHCFFWLPELLWLHAVSNVLSAVGYYSLGGAIIYFAQGRKDLPRSTLILLVGMLLVFFVCGTTHIFNTLTIWYPMYWLAGIIQAINAVISLYVFLFLLVPLIPVALEAPSPAKLAAANRALKHEIEERCRSEEQLRHSEMALKEKTAALVQANEEIQLLNQRLKTENLRMSTELEVTRHLQQMMLPKEEELSQIKNLEIVGFMEPANEVGGDYYDVLQRDGRVKIGIGDVTGHGLESGVLMLMVQTAVRTLLANGVTDAKTFFNALNYTIYNNLQRMHSDKNLTLSLLDYKDGVVHLSGQHEEMLIVRKGGIVERVDTINLGFMVGLEEDISRFVTHLEVLLQPGDGVVLYTDGITEALSQGREMYGVERLCQILSRYWDEYSAKQIQQAVIADLRQHISTQQLYDDITLLIIKQK